MFLPLFPLLPSPPHPSLTKKKKGRKLGHVTHIFPKRPGQKLRQILSAIHHIFNLVLWSSCNEVCLFRAESGTVRN